VKSVKIIIKFDQPLATQIIYYELKKKYHDMIQYEFDYYYNYHCLLIYRQARIAHSCGYNYSFINHRYIILSILLCLFSERFTVMWQTCTLETIMSLRLRTRLIICIMRCLLLPKVRWF
jgi:hypothetical protein